MIPARVYYREGQYNPTNDGSSWSVWCISGALAVLNESAWREMLEVSNEPVCIKFAHGSAARILSSDPLWQTLVEIAKTHTVKVLPITWFTTEYKKWTGEEGSVSAFDVIEISRKEVQLNPGEHNARIKSAGVVSRLQAPTASVTLSSR